MINIQKIKSDWYGNKVTCTYEEYEMMIDRVEENEELTVALNNARKEIHVLESRLGVRLDD